MTPADRRTAVPEALAGVAMAAAVTAAAVTVAAVLWPDPGRHARGLLIVLALTLIGGVVSAGLQVVVDRDRGRAQPP